MDRFRLILISLISLLLVCLLQFGQASEFWYIIVSKSLQQDEAVKVAVEDLVKTGKQFGIHFTIKNDGKKVSRNTILVGAPARNQQAAALLKHTKVQFEAIDDPQGFEIVTIDDDDRKSLCIAGGSVVGDVNGLYWIWDRLRVYKQIPEINVVRTPDLKIRFCGSGSSKEAMRNALRYSATWVWGGPSVNHLVPWDAKPERSENAKNREKIRELINYAHSLHLKFFVYEDEFSYHPTLLQEYGATLSPEDPAFWDAVQNKYRRLLKALPEIDGVRFRTGELTRVGGSFRPFDVMHEGENCDWSLAKRYRTWVKKIYNVVVGEFDKIYYQRTWVTSAYEQHSMAEVYKQIFTDDVPVRNLYLSPYLSTTDRYFHQPYNPTFNQTPHNMIVLLASLDYHSSGRIPTFPTFPGQYFQAGLKTIMVPKNHNLRGVDAGAPNINDWNTGGVTGYTAWRLVWNHKEDVREIARDFASIHFGREAADEIAELYLISPNAYKYGIYIEPVSYGDFRSLQQLRTTTFPAKGFPRLDHGKKHLDFLYKLYLRCQPWMEETLLYLDHGLDLANAMVEKAQKIKSATPKDKADDLLHSVLLTQRLIKSNNLYTKTFFSYFDYRENPTDDNKITLLKNATALMNALQQFLDTPGCGHRVDGMEQLLKSVDYILEDYDREVKRLAEAPDDEQIKELIAEQQKKYAEVLQQHQDEAVKYLYWHGRVDGRDLIKTKGDTLEVEHLRYDAIAEMSYEFFAPLPHQEVTVIPVDIQSRSYRPFVLEQPSQKNGYQAVIYLSDYPRHGYSWWKFELVYIAKPAAEVGLTPPWRD